jgi:hypothetical protein
VIALLAGSGGESRLVEGPSHDVAIRSVELDLDAEGLVGIADDVLAFVGRGGCRHCKALELAVQGFVGRERSLAFRDLLTLEPQELLPELLGLLLLVLGPLALRSIPVNGSGIEGGLFRCIDRGVVVDDGWH